MATSLTLRSVKGSALTIAEEDGNATALRATADAALALAQIVISPYANFAAFPAPGAAGILYVDLSTLKIYVYASGAYALAAPTDAAAVRALALTGLVTTDATPVDAATQLVIALGRLQAQINARPTAYGGLSDAASVDLPNTNTPLGAALSLLAGKFVFVPVTASRNLAAADFNSPNILVNTSATNLTFTLPNGLGLLPGTICGFQCLGTGGITIVAGSGVTIRKIPGASVPRYETDFVTFATGEIYNYEAQTVIASVTNPDLTLSIANSTPTKLVMTPTIALNTAQTQPAVGDFALIKNGGAGTINSVAFNAGNLEATLPVAAISTDVFTLGYVQGALRILSKTGLPVLDFAGRVVTNNVVATPVPGAATIAPAGSNTTSAISYAITAPTVDGSHGAATQYKVYYKRTVDSTYTLFSTGASLTGTVTGLTANTGYQLKAVAGNATGDGPDSNVITQSTTAGVVTTFIRQQTLVAYTETGNGGTGYNYLSTNDGTAYNTSGGILLTQDGSVEVTIGAITSNFQLGLGTALTVGAADFGAAGAYQMYWGSGGSLSIFDNGSNLTPSVPEGDTFVGTVGFKIRLRCVGKVVIAEVWDTTRWWIVHVFTSARVGTLYPTMRTFNSGNQYNVLTQVQGPVQTYFADSSASLGLDGNSLAFLDSGNGTMIYRASLKSPLLGSRTTITNVSIDGQTTAQMTSNHADMDAAFNAAKTYNIAVVWEGTNSIADYIQNQGFTVSAAVLAAVADLQAYISAIKTAKAWSKIVVMNTIPRQGGQPDGATLTNLNTALVNYNAYIAANMALLGIDAICDLRQAGSPWAALTTYTTAGFLAWQTTYNLFFDASPNYIHNNDAGNEVAAGYLCATLSTLGIP